MEFNKCVCGWELGIDSVILCDSYKGPFYCPACKAELTTPESAAPSGQTDFAGSVTVESEAHIIMTEDEYSELKIIGWHKVCKNIDSAGNVGVQYLGETK